MKLRVMRYQGLLPKNNFSTMYGNTAYGSSLSCEGGGIVLSNESRVAHYSRTHGVPCVRLADILRALWMEGIDSQQEVLEIIRDLQVTDPMQCTHSTLQAICAE